MQYLTSILGYANANYRKVRGTQYQVSSCDTDTW